MAAVKGVYQEQTEVTVISDDLGLKNHTLVTQC